MVMPTVRCFVVIMFVNRNPAIIFVMVMLIDADLCSAMRRVVNRPCRNWNAHAKCKPEEGKQAQDRTCSVIHSRFSRRRRENRQS